MNQIKLMGLTAVVSHKEKGKASHIYIGIKTSSHNIGVAHATLGGKYTEEQALKAFARERPRFTMIPEGEAMAKALKLI